MKTNVKNKRKRRLRNLVIKIYGAIGALLFFVGLIMLAGVEGQVQCYNTEIPLRSLIIFLAVFCIGGLMIREFQDVKNKSKADDIKLIKINY